MKKLLLLFALSCPVMFSGCAMQEAKPDSAMISGNLVLTEAQNGSEILVSVGRQIDVRLPSNRSTGYQWQQVEPMRGILRDASPHYEQATPEIPGSGGVDIFNFTASRPGKQILRFEYNRAWSESTASTQKINFTVVVE